MNKYKYWDVLQVMPEGWEIDKTSGSPLAGHEFITNGKSVIDGQQRALLKIERAMPVEQPVQHVEAPELKKTMQSELFA